MQILLDLLNFLTPYGVYSYIIMFSILILCGFGLPMPEDIILIAGGILSASGICNPWITLAVCMTGVLLGDSVVFLLGQRYGQGIKRSILFRRILTPEIDLKVQNFFKKYGDKVIFAARFMPGLRMPIFLSAGIYKIKFWKFFLFDGIAAVASVPLWIYAGYAFGSNLDILEEKIRQFQTSIYVTLALALSAILCYRIVKRMRRSKAAAAAADELNKNISVSPTSNKTGNRSVASAIKHTADDSTGTTLT